jgi:hypothetical protein
MPIVAAFVLLAFWFRDYMSLRMSPSNKATRRAVAYGAAILFTAVLLWTLAVRVGVGDFARRIQLPPILLLLVAFHVGASVLSFWAPQFSFFAVAVLWGTSMIVVIFRTRHSEMPLHDLDFAVLFGGLSHWLAMCALPLALLVTP